MLHSLWARTQPEHVSISTSKQYVPVGTTLPSPSIVVIVAGRRDDEMTDAMVASRDHAHLSCTFDHLRTILLDWKTIEQKFGTPKLIREFIHFLTQFICSGISMIKAVLVAEFYFSCRCLGWHRVVRLTDSRRLGGRVQ